MRLQAVGVVGSMAFILLILGLVSMPASAESRVDGYLRYVA